MGRKDRERFLRLKDANPEYSGFRGAETVAAPTPPPPPVTESVTCSSCGRKRNVSVDTLPEDRSSFVCIRCQEEPLSQEETSD